MSQRRSLLFKKGGSAFDFKNALHFDGIDDYVQIGALNYSGGALNLWFTKPTGNDQRILSVTGGGVKLPGIGYDSAYDRIKLWAIAGANTWTNITQDALNNGWNHLCFSLDGTILSIWLNGVIQILQGSATLPWGSVPYALGSKYRLLYGSYFEGKMDEFAMEDGLILTQTDIDFLFNDFQGNDVSKIFTGANRIYTFNETSGSTTTDSSGNGNNGTLTNFPVDDSQWVAH